MGVPALCMAALSFPIAAVSIILSAAFQSLGHSGSSLLIALLRQILLLLPIAALFLWLVPDGVWLSFLIAETITCVATLLLYRRTVRPLIAALAVPVLRQTLLLPHTELLPVSSCELVDHTNLFAYFCVILELHFPQNCDT